MQRPAKRAAPWQSLLEVVVDCVERRRHHQQPVVARVCHKRAQRAVHGHARPPSALQGRGQRGGQCAASTCETRRPAHQNGRMSRAVPRTSRSARCKAWGALRTSASSVASANAVFASSVSRLTLTGLKLKVPLSFLLRCTSTGCRPGAAGGAAVCGVACGGEALLCQVVCPSWQRCACLVCSKWLPCDQSCGRHAPQATQRHLAALHPHPAGAHLAKGSRRPPARL